MSEDLNQWALVVGLEPFAFLWRSWLQNQAGSDCFMVLSFVVVLNDLLDRSAKKKRWGSAVSPV